MNCIECGRINWWWWTLLWSPIDNCCHVFVINAQRHLKYANNGNERFTDSHIVSRLFIFNIYVCRRIWKQQCQQIDNNSSYRTFIIQQINETTATTCNCCNQQQQQYYRNISEDIMRGIVANGNTIGDTTIKYPLNHNYKSRWDTFPHTDTQQAKWSEKW